MLRTNYHDLKDARAIEVLLYKLSAGCVIHNVCLKWECKKYSVLSHLRTISWKLIKIYVFVSKERTKNENWRLVYEVFVYSYVFLSCICPLFDYQSNQNRFDRPKRNKNIIWSMVKYAETFYGRHMTLKAPYSSKIDILLSKKC